MTHATLQGNGKASVMTLCVLLKGSRFPGKAAVFGLAMSALMVASAPNGTAAAQQLAETRDEPDVMRYLSSEPATLLDLGFFRVRSDLQQIATAHADPDYPTSPPRAGIFFNWRGRTLQAYVAIPTSADRRTAANCRQIFTEIADALTAYGPKGADRTERYLEEVFGHAGPRFWQDRRPRNFGERISNRLTFTVTLTGDASDHRYGDIATLKCFGRLDAKDMEIQVASNEG